MLTFLPSRRTTPAARASAGLAVVALLILAVLTPALPSWAESGAHRTPPPPPAITAPLPETHPA